jgi:hypothetical protein
MKKTCSVLAAAVAIGSTAIGITIAPPAAADPTSNCQTVGGSTVCAQGGDVRGGKSGVSPGPASGSRGGGCTNAYGSYQNCNGGH